MCIRDSPELETTVQGRRREEVDAEVPGERDQPDDREYETCLLYTSDAADERSSVDLGGRRILKKKT